MGNVGVAQPFPAFPLQGREARRESDDRLARQPRRKESRRGGHCWRLTPALAAAHIPRGRQSCVSARPGRGARSDLAVLFPGPAGYPEGNRALSADAAGTILPSCSRRAVRTVENPARAEERLARSGAISARTWCRQRRLRAASAPLCGHRSRAGRRIASVTCMVTLQGFTPGEART